MQEPSWALLNYPKIDYQDSYYYAAPKKKPARNPSTRSIRNCCACTRSSAYR